MAFPVIPEDVPVLRPVWPDDPVWASLVPMAEALVMK